MLRCSTFEALRILQLRQWRKRCSFVTGGGGICVLMMFFIPLPHCKKKSVSCKSKICTSGNDPGWILSPRCMCICVFQLSPVNAPVLFSSSCFGGRGHFPLMQLILYFLQPSGKLPASLASRGDGQAPWKPLAPVPYLAAAANGGKDALGGIPPSSPSSLLFHLLQLLSAVSGLMASK